MKYAVVFFLVTVVCGLEAYLLMDSWGWLLLWPGLSFLGVSLAYAGLGPKIFGKRADGSIPRWVVLAYFPYLLPTWIIWRVQCLFAREPACQQIAPGLWLGRRLLPAEVPAGATLIVDLTAEFSEPATIRSNRDYLTLPTLDGHVPSAEKLRHLVEQISVCGDGNVVVHCASGHGRSAMVVACVLIAKGLARDALEAEQIIKTIRPRIGLSPAQRKRVEEFARSRSL